MFFRCSLLETSHTGWSWRHLTFSVERSGSVKTLGQVITPRTHARTLIHTHFWVIKTRQPSAIPKKEWVERDTETENKLITSSKYRGVTADTHTLVTLERTAAFLLFHVFRWASDLPQTGRGTSVSCPSGSWRTRQRVRRLSVDQETSRGHTR